MNFEEELVKLLANTEGAQAAVLMGYDGIVVAQAASDPNLLPLIDVAVEFSGVFKELMKIAQGNNLGEVQEVSMMTAGYRFAFRAINSEYFLGLLMGDNANSGKARYLLRLSAPQFSGELST